MNYTSDPAPTGLVHHQPVWRPADLPIDAEGNTRPGFECVHPLENGNGPCGGTVFRVEDAVGTHCCMVESDSREQQKVDPREVVARIQQAIEDGYVVTCSECSEELPSDSRCDVADDGEHVPDQELDEPPDDDPTRWIELALSVKVPNDGYDYLTDVTGRLETLLSLLNLHPLVTGAATLGPSGSGYVKDVESW